MYTLNFTQGAHTFHIGYESLSLARRAEARAINHHATEVTVTLA